MCIVSFKGTSIGSLIFKKKKKKQISVSSTSPKKLLKIESNPFLKHAFAGHFACHQMLGWSSLANPSEQPY